MFPIYVWYWNYFSHFLILGGYGETEETISEGLRTQNGLKTLSFFLTLACASILAPVCKSWLYKKESSRMMIICWNLLITWLMGSNYSTLKTRADKPGEGSYSLMKMLLRSWIKCGHVKERNAMASFEKIIAIETTIGQYIPQRLLHHDRKTSGRDC